MVFTAMAIFGAWLVRDNPEYTFSLALAAHGQAFVGMGALGWAMGRRQVSSATKDGITFDDRGS